MGEIKNLGRSFIAYSLVNLDAGFEYGRDERGVFIEIFGMVRQRIDAFIDCTAQRHDQAAVRKTITGEIV